MTLLVVSTGVNNVVNKGSVESPTTTYGDPTMGKKAYPINI